jgi:beta-phosphoglucomutase-like phosphatase (HAD superfamily)
MATDSEHSVSQNILLFELEGAAIDGRGKLFEAAQQVFKQAGLTLKENVFARYCVHAAPAYVVEQLVAEQGGDKLNGDAASHIVSVYVDLMRKAKHKPSERFTKVINEAVRRGMKITALTVLPEDIARQALDQSGIGDKGVELILFPENERHFPRTECWLRIPRTYNRSPRACIAIAGCRDSGKSALSAGMRCIVVPDQFTSYQDFSGVDAVLDGDEDYTLADLIDAIA